MPRRILSEKNIRKLIKLGGEDGSLALTIPKGVYPVK